MDTIRKCGLIIVPVLLLLLSACGSSSSGTGADPLSNGTNSNQTDQTSTPVTAVDPTVSLVLETDLAKPTELSTLPQVDANIGTVLLTGRMLNMGESVLLDPTTNAPIGQGAPIPNQLISFNVVAGPAAIGYSTPVTDRNGEAFAVLTTGNADYTTNVIVEASATLSGKIYRAYTQFQIVRGTGKIELANDVNVPEYRLPSTYPVGAEFDILHQFSFLLTDSNGNPRVGVPVTLSVHSSIPDVPVFLDYTTIRTGSDGVGWFNARVTLYAPGPGLMNSASVIYKARTNDSYPLINYKGSLYKVVQDKLSSASK
ncbi:MAG TPA: hypothetical protein DCZ75_19680 [Geobacter sp.]|nr:hypothetical protein [Geobacter sp.]